MLDADGYETETLDKLYLEWSQFTTARTAREMELISLAADLSSGLREVFKLLEPHRENKVIAEAYLKARIVWDNASNVDVFKEQHRRERTAASLTQTEPAHD